MGSMTKYALIARLEELGFQTAIIDSIPYILNVPYEVADRAIKALGYDRSWGVKTIKEEVTNEIL